MYRLFISSFLMMLPFLSVITYGQRPQVGEPMPDFVLKNITHYETTAASLNDFKGKWLFLDFWFKNCFSCIASFPKVNKFQQEFKNEIQYLLVADVDDDRWSQQKTADTKLTYEVLREKKGLDIPCVYDSLLAHKWEIYSMPCIIIIDPNGIVKAITNGSDLTSNKIRILINGGMPDLSPSVSFASLVDFNPGIDHKNLKESDSLIVYESTLAKFNGERNVLLPLDYEMGRNEFIRKGYVLTGGYSLNMVYNMAYFGAHLWSAKSPLYEKVYPVPVLEIKNKSLFEANDDPENIKKGRYNYKVTIPSNKKPTKEYIMGIIQNDLKNVFGYDVSIENRKMPYYKLIALPGAIEHLRNKGASYNTSSSKYSVDGSGGFKYTRVNMDDVFGSCIYYLPEAALYTMPFFNETGITDKVDIEISADMNKIDQVRKELKKNRLDLVRSEREFKVLVIRDPKPVTFLTEEFFIKRSVLSSVDSFEVDKIITQYVKPTGRVDWDAFNKSISEKFPENAEQIILTTKLEYYFSKRDSNNFDSILLIHLMKFPNTLEYNKVISYANFVLAYSMNEDVLNAANGAFRKVYFDTKITPAIPKEIFYMHAKISYKYGVVIKSNKNKPNVERGREYIDGGILFMKNRVLAADPNNKLYLETLAKMEKELPVW